MKTVVNDQHYKNRMNMLKRSPGEKFAALASVAVRTQGEVASILGMSQQAVHATERRALWKIRRAMRGVYREWRTQ